MPLSRHTASWSIRAGVGSACTRRAGSYKSYSSYRSHSSYRFSARASRADGDCLGGAPPGGVGQVGRVGRVGRRRDSEVPSAFPWHAVVPAALRRGSGPAAVGRRRQPATIIVIRYRRRYRHPTSRCPGPLSGQRAGISNIRQGKSNVHGAGCRDMPRSPVPHLNLNRYLNRNHHRSGIRPPLPPLSRVYIRCCPSAFADCRFRSGCRLRLRL